MTDNVFANNNNFKKKATDDVSAYISRLVSHEPVQYSVVPVDDTGGAVATLWA